MSAKTLQSPATFIPAHWRTGSLRHFTRFTTGWTPPTGNDDDYVGDNLWANISDLGDRWIDETRKSLSDAAVAGEPRAEVGDLLFAFKLSVGAVSRVAVPMYTNEAIACFRPSDDLDLAFAYYALPHYLSLSANTNIYGAALLNSFLMKAAPFAAPDIAEQRAIAAYLDRETVQVDALIGKQEQLIEKLQERRVALLTSAFKGLDGVRCSIASVALTGGFRDGDWVESKDQDPAGAIRLLQLADVGDGRFRDRSDRRINDEAFVRLRCSPVLPGDVLIARMPDPLGRACVVPGGPWADNYRCRCGRAACGRIPI